MKYILYITSLVFLAAVFSCGKSSDYFYKEYLDQAETAKPGMVDSLQLFPGKNRAKLKFLIPPDKRVNKIVVNYNTSLSAEIKNIEIDVAADDSGKRKEVELNDIPESTIMISVQTKSISDQSNIASISGKIYGSQYSSNLSNRIFVNFTLSNGIRIMNLLQESGLPQDPTVFTAMRYTEIIYPTIYGEEKNLIVSPYVRNIELIDASSSGVVKYRTFYMPEEKAIDVFSGPWSNVEIK